jgi:hypothetical protein
MYQQQRTYGDALFVSHLILKVKLGETSWDNHSNIFLISYNVMRNINILHDDKHKFSTLYFLYFKSF